MAGAAAIHKAVHSNREQLQFKVAHAVWYRCSGKVLKVLQRRSAIGRKGIM